METHHGRALAATTDAGKKALEEALEPVYEGAIYTVLDAASRALELRDEFKNVSMRACSAWVDMFCTLLPEGHRLGSFETLMKHATNVGMVRVPVVRVCRFLPGMR